MYVTGLLALYAMLVAPGSSILPAMGEFGFQGFPPEGLALLVALFLTGVGVAPIPPNGLTLLRNTCDAWCMLGSWFRTELKGRSGCSKMRAMNPPQSQLNLCRAAQGKASGGFEIAPGDAEISLGARDDPDDIAESRWVRAHPLQKAAFDPFQEDFSKGFS